MQFLRADEEVEEELFDGVDAADLVAVHPGKYDDPRPISMSGNSYEIRDLRIFIDHDRTNLSFRQCRLPEKGDDGVRPEVRTTP